LTLGYVSTADNRKTLHITRKDIDKNKITERLFMNIFTMLSREVKIDGKDLLINNGVYKSWFI